MEALEAHPGSFKLKMKTRKGFIRLALETGYVEDTSYKYLTIGSIVFLSKLKYQNYSMINLLFCYYVLSLYKSPQNLCALLYIPFCHVLFDI